MNKLNASSFRKLMLAAHPDRKDVSIAERNEATRLLNDLKPLFGLGKERAC
jgi:hypothetical protein